MNAISVAYLLLLMFASALYADSVVEVIPVFNRPASEIQPLLMPLLEQSDQAVANGDSLIIKTTRARLGEISQLIRKLDNPLNNLLISVIQSRDTTAEQLNAGIDFEIHTQNNSDFRQEGNRPHVEGQIYQQRSQINSTDNHHNKQTIRTMDGRTAHIKLGKTYPITQYQVYPGTYGYPGVTQSTQLVEASTGFDVTPRRVGQQVMLEVSPWSDRFNSSGQIQTQEANTSVRVNLGEWVEIGGVDESGQSGDNSTWAYRRQSRQNNLHILVKVDLVN